MKKIKYLYIVISFVLIFSFMVFGQDKSKDDTVNLKVLEERVSQIEKNVDNQIEALEKQTNIQDKAFEKELALRTESLEKRMYLYVGFIIALGTLVSILFTIFGGKWVRQTAVEYTLSRVIIIPQ